MDCGDLAMESRGESVGMGARAAPVLAVVLLAVLGLLFAGRGARDGSGAEAVAAPVPSPASPAVEPARDPPPAAAGRAAVGVTLELYVRSEGGQLERPIGDGILYARTAGARESEPASRLAVRSGSVVVDPGVAAALRPVAARIGERAYRASGSAEGEGTRVLLVPFAGRLLDVTDRAGEPVGAIRIERYRQAGLAGPAFHPGASAEEHLVREDAGSPVLLEESERALARGRVFLRAGTSRWVRLELAAPGPACVDVRLAPGCELVVEVGPRPDPAEWVLVLRSVDGEQVGGIPLHGDSVLIDGLPPGELQVALELRRGGGERALAEARATLVEGERTLVRLSGEISPAPLAAGFLAGRLDLSRLEARAISELGPSLRIECLHVTPHPLASDERPRGALQSLRLDAMVPLAHAERIWSWRTRPLAPGGYRLVVHPFGLLVEAWLEPGLAQELSLVLPELAEASVRWVHGATGAVLAPRVHSVTRVETLGGEPAGARVDWEAHPAPDARLEIRCVPGVLNVAHFDPEGELRFERLEVPPGKSEQRIELHPLRWLEFDVAGPGGPLSPPAEWWDALSFVRDGEPLEPESVAYSFPSLASAEGEGIPRLRVAVRGEGSLTVLVPDHPEFGPQRPLRIPSADPGAAARLRVTLELR